MIPCHKQPDHQSIHSREEGFLLFFKIKATFAPCDQKEIFPHQTLGKPSFEWIDCGCMKSVIKVNSINGCHDKPTFFVSTIPPPPHSIYCRYTSHAICFRLIIQTVSSQENLKSFSPSGQGVVVVVEVYNPKWCICIKSFCCHDLETLERCGCSSSKPPCLSHVIFI